MKSFISSSFLWSLYTSCIPWYPMQARYLSEVSNLVEYLETMPITHVCFYLLESEQQLNNSQSFCTSTYLAPSPMTTGLEWTQRNTDVCLVHIEWKCINQWASHSASMTSETCGFQDGEWLRSNNTLGTTDNLGGTLKWPIYPVFETQGRLYQKQAKSKTGMYRMLLSFPSERKHALVCPDFVSRSVKVQEYPGVCTSHQESGRSADTQVYFFY